MYLMPLNCTLKMVKMVNFMLYILYYNKKRLKPNEIKIAKELPWWSSG